jgi:isopentenyl diphosphate isomerase/L-lactate dehydrogenase-like FMN-dependent dehydrogenase
MVVSATSSYTWEEIAGLAGARWAQVYGYRDRGVRRALLERAATAGYGAICRTVDTVRVRSRYRNLRNRFAVPGHIRRANLESIDPKLAGPIEVTRYAAEHYDDTLTWKDLEWFRTASGLPLVLKGIVHPDDAREAVASGVAGRIFSNQGGRQLDGSGSSICALPAVADAARSDCELYLDGGVRRGVDVAGALALGARAVLVGQPYLWGLAAAGEEGVSHALALFHKELAMTLALLGVASPVYLGRGSVRVSGEWT